jgi:serine/threonine-protein kinase RsbW
MSAQPRPDRAARTGEPTQRVELSVPARPDMVVLARLTAAAVASRADFGVDQLEDLRLAIDEMCITLVDEHLGHGQLALTFEWTADTITVTGRHRPGDSAAEQPAPVRRFPEHETARTMRAELSKRIMKALVEEHGSDLSGPGPCMWFSVRRRGAR